MATLGFWNLAQQQPEAPALIAPGECRYSRGELLAESNRLVHGLRAIGLEPGDTVALMAPNCAEYYVVYLAATQAGFYLVPINWRLAGPEVAYILQDSEARAFITHEQVANAAKSAVAEAGLDRDCAFVIGSIAGFRRYDELLESQPDTMPENRRAGYIMNYTSGTTGKPKAVRRALPDMSPDDLYEIMPSMLTQTFGIQAESGNVHYCGSPLYHSAPLQWSGSSLHLGHTVVLVEKWDPEHMLRDIEKYGVTVSHMVPTQFVRLLKLPEQVRSRYDVSSLRQIIHAAAPCPPDVKRAMLDWWGDIIYEYYAGTEGGSTICTPQEWRKYPGTVGRAPGNAGVRIFDEDGNELGPNQTGIVYMKVMDGMDFEYKGDREKTAKNRIGNYFTLGDIGHLNEEGYLFLSDRKIDMIISGGANIYPAEIENALILHPRVADCAVFGIPDDEWGEQVKAVVQPTADTGNKDTLADEIMAFLETRVARMKLPRSIDFVDELPRDPNGKLYKRKLRDPYWQNRERKV